MTSVFLFHGSPNRIREEMVFTVRQAGFPQNGGAANDAIVAYDLNTGQELWRHTLAFGGNTSEQWIAWICGVDDGRVYASRSATDRIQPITALDAFDGTVLWTSQASTRASLDIFDIRGGHVRRLMEDAHGPGGFTVDWDGLDARGQEAPAGVYIYRLSAGGTLLTRKMALIR